MNVPQLVSKLLPAGFWLRRDGSTVEHRVQTSLAKGIFAHTNAISDTARKLASGSSADRLATAASRDIRNAHPDEQAFYTNIANLARHVADAPTGKDVISRLRAAHPNFLRTKAGETGLARIKDLPYADPALKARDLLTVRGLISDQETRAFYDTLAFANAATPSRGRV